MICNIQHVVKIKKDIMCQKKGLLSWVKVSILHVFSLKHLFLKLLWVKRKLLSRVVFLKPHIARPCVTLHSFHPGNARCLQSNRSVGLRCKFLPSELLHKLLDREASSVPGNPSSGKDMVWPGCLVSMGHC